MAYQNRIDPARLVFIDETWTKTNMAPLRGWAPYGQRLPGKAPYGRWKTMTFLAALRHDRVTAPWLVDGPIDGQSFLQYVEEVLMTTLKPGDIVIIDNHGSHKGKAVRQANPRCMRQALLPAQVRPGSQSDRKVLCQAQALAAKCRYLLRGNALNPCRLLVGYLGGA